MAEVAGRGAGLGSGVTRLFSIGRWLYAAAAIASGVEQLVRLRFVRLVPGFPAWMPGPAIWAGLAGAFLVLAGAALLTDRWRGQGAVAAGALLAWLFAGGFVPQIAGNPLTGYIWTNPCKTLALLSGTILLAAGPATGPGRAESGAVRWRLRTQPLAWIFPGVFLAVCGVQHFFYADFVRTLVPAWIPPAPGFWTYFAGVALIAGGVGLALRRIRALAALLSGTMVLLWVLLLHIPRAVWMRSAFELDGVFEATAIGGVCWMLAAVAAPWPPLRPAGPGAA